MWVQKSKTFLWPFFILFAIFSLLYLFANVIKTEFNAGLSDSDLEDTSYAYQKKQINSIYWSSVSHYKYYIYYFLIILKHNIYWQINCECNQSEGMHIWQLATFQFLTPTQSAIAKQRKQRLNKQQLLK